MNLQSVQGFCADALLVDFVSPSTRFETVDAFEEMSAVVATQMSFRSIEHFHHDWSSSRRPQTSVPWSRFPFPQTSRDQGLD